MSADDVKYHSPTVGAETCTPVHDQPPVKTHAPDTAVRGKTQVQPMAGSDCVGVTRLLSSDTMTEPGTTARYADTPLGEFCIAPGAILVGEDDKKSDTPPVLRAHSLTCGTHSASLAMQRLGESSPVESLTPRDGTDKTIESGIIVKHVDTPTPCTTRSDNMSPDAILERAPMSASLQCDQVTSYTFANHGERSEGPEPPAGGTVAGFPLSGVIGTDVGTAATIDQVGAEPMDDQAPKHSQNAKRAGPTSSPPLSDAREERKGEGPHPIQTVMGLGGKSKLPSRTGSNVKSKDALSRANQQGLRPTTTTSLPTSHELAPQEPPHELPAGFASRTSSRAEEDAPTGASSTSTATSTSRPQPQQVDDQRVPEVTESSLIMTTDPESVPKPRNKIHATTGPVGVVRESKQDTQHVEHLPMKASRILPTGSMHAEDKDSIHGRGYVDIADSERGPPNIGEFTVSGVSLRTYHRSRDVTDESFPQGNLCPQVRSNHPVGVQLQRRINHIQQEQWSMSPMNKLRASEPLFRDHTADPTVAAATLNEALRNLVLKDPSIGDRQHDHRAYLQMELGRYEGAGANSEHGALQKLDQLVRTAQMDERFITTVLSDGTAPTQFRHGQSAKARTTAQKGGAAQGADPALRETALATGQHAPAAGVIIAPRSASTVASSSSLARRNAGGSDPGKAGAKFHEVSAAKVAAEIKGDTRSINFDTREGQTTMSCLPSRENPTQGYQRSGIGANMKAKAIPENSEKSIRMRSDSVALL